MSNKIFLVLVLFALAIPFASALNYNLFTNSCTFNASGQNCDLSYTVTSPNTFVVLTSAAGFDPIGSITLPTGCTQQQFITGPDGFETGVIATCIQNAGSYDFNSTSNSTDNTFISTAAYVFDPGNYSFLTNSNSGTGNNLSLTVSSGFPLYLCAGGAGNDVVENESGLVDVSDSDSAIWNQANNVCFVATPSTDLALAGIGILNGSLSPANGFGYNCNGYVGYGYMCIPTGGGNNIPPLSLSVNPSCTNNTVTVGNGGTGAHVSVKDVTTGLLIFSGDTKNGVAGPFQGCGQVSILATSSGTLPAQQDFQLMACNQCTPPPQCQSNADCPDTQMCSNQSCVPVPCTNGHVVNHVCIPNPQNQTNQTQNVCTAPTCCTMNSQCGDTQACDTPTGAPASAQTPGSCQQVTGQCGYPTNHTWVAYQCGSSPNCPSCPTGQSCVNNLCVQNTITCPSSTVVNSTITCQVNCGSGTSCNVTVIAPDGKTTSVTSQNGVVQFQVTEAGNYNFANGPSATATLNSIAPPPSSNPTVPTQASGPDYGSMLILLILLLIIIAIIIYYWRSRGQKGK